MCQSYRSGRWWSTTVSSFKLSGNLMLDSLALASTWLASHAVAFDAHREIELADVGDQLLSRASDLGADLVVCGGYGHSRLREWALGGVTKHLLAHMTVPTLFSH